MLVGYRLIQDDSGAVVAEWGGVFGVVPQLPNPLFLPDGNHVHAPRLNQSYNGYRLVEWQKERSITADDVRAEAQRRIIALTGTATIIDCLIKQHNAQMRATELTLIKATGGNWTIEQAAEAAALQSMADKIKAIRAASNVLETSLPFDYADNRHWQGVPSAGSVSV